MDETEIAEVDAALREILRQAELGRIVEEVDATIMEGRSISEKRKIDKGAASEELVAVDYSARERYELLLDAVRRATVEPAAYEESAEKRLIGQVGASSITFMSPGRRPRRTIGRTGAVRPEDLPVSGVVDPERKTDRERALEIEGLLAELDPRDLQKSHVDARD